MTNFEIALKAEMKRAVRVFWPYTLEQRGSQFARHGSLRVRTRRGEFRYIHPTVPGVAFRRRSDAARAALDAA